MNLRQYIYNLKEKIFLPSAEERERIERLRGKIRAVSQKGARNARLSSWQSNIEDLQEQILHRDPRFFLQWDMVRYTMVHECKQTELDYLQSLPNWPLWEQAIIQSSVGNPSPYPTYKKSSGNLIHQAYSIAQLIGRFPFDIAQIKTIVEFGGGYGSMARLLFRLGFKGQYIIFDLPEFSYLQEYYLNAASIGAQILTEPSPNQESAVILLSELEKLATQIKLSGRPDLFIALWSLSESPIALRKEIIRLVADAKTYLIAYQDKFEDIDNTAYFNEVGNSMGLKERQSYQISHLKGKHFYFLGTKT